MNRALVTLFVSLLLVPAAAFAVPPEGVKAEADSIAAELATVSSRAKGLTSDSAKEIRKAFFDATKFVQKVARSNMAEKDKGELIIQVAGEAGKAFDDLTEPYENPVQVEKPRYGFRDVWQTIGARVAAVFGSLARDVKT
jgi:hypothetical protein